MKSFEERRIPMWEKAASPAEAEAVQQSLYALMRDRLYGRMPAAPDAVRAEPVGKTAGGAEELFGGKAIHRRYRLSFAADKGEASFEYDYFAPCGGGKHPFFVNISFYEPYNGYYLPAEEIIDRGYGIASFCYKNVSADADVWDGIAPFYAMDRTHPDDWGKIGIWAFAASRVLDHLLTHPEVDAGRVAVIGHSRLGKTALWAGANDRRFSLVISNESGCGGAAINRGKVGETLSGMTDVFPYWFSPAMQALRGVAPEELDFDAHDLLALIAPRHLLVGSAAGDQWADPQSELYACRAASPMWEAFGKTGLVCHAETPEAGKVFHEGTVGYHMRPGSHAMSRTDWNIYMDYRDKHHI